MQNFDEFFTHLSFFFGRFRLHWMNTKERLEPITR